ncbi:MAG: PaaI family thioesterase, partial [Deltaproteobacteria bacterium]|nr:PaaI family thioesterase [Deltaproteobacteria bacterium]
MRQVRRPSRSCVRRWAAADQPALLHQLGVAEVRQGQIGVADPVAFQDQGSVHHCHGCGAANEKGLQLKSYWDGDEAVATWRAQPHHCGGTRENLNGGIIASLIDCHSLNLAIAQASRLETRAIGSAPRIGYVTANMNIDYLKPTPIDELIDLRARIT